MELSLILKVSEKEPEEIKIIIPQGEKEVCCESIKLDRPLTKISVNGPWSNVLKSKITKGYVAMGKSEAMAKTIIKEGLFDAIVELQDQYMTSIENAKEMEAHDQEKNEKTKIEEIHRKGEEFRQYLKDHNATPMNFLDFISHWLLSGELKNIQTGFFAHFSTLTGLRPVWTIYLGGPGEGKTATEEASRDLIPNRFKYSGRATYAVTMNQAEEYGSDFLDRCVISLGDLGGKNSYIKWEETLDVYKEVSSEGEYDYKKTSDVIDPETKKRQTTHLIIKGYPSVSFASTHGDGLTGQYLSRGITLTPEGSDDEVLRYRRFTRPGTFALEFRDNLTTYIMDLFHNYIEELLLNIETVEVINPYYLCLQEWFKKAANKKRSSEMFPLLVDAVTLFNYESRHKVLSPNGKTYYIATKEDNETIASLFDITPGLTAEVVAFYNDLVRVVGKWDYEEFELYQDGKKEIKDCKTIFTIGTLKNQRLRKKSSDIKSQFSDFCHLLHDSGKLTSLMKNSKGHHVYCLTDPRPIGIADIEFKNELILQYLEEDVYDQNWGMRLTESEMMKCMSDEKPQKNITHKFIMPPWDSFGTPLQGNFSNISDTSMNEIHSEVYNTK